MTSPYFYLRILSSLGRSRASFWAIGCKNETVTRLPKRIGTSRSAARLGWPRDRVAELPCCDGCATLARAGQHQRYSSKVVASGASPVAYFGVPGAHNSHCCAAAGRRWSLSFNCLIETRHMRGRPFRAGASLRAGGDCLPPLVSQDWKRSKSRQCHGQDYVYSARRNRTRRRG